MFNFLRPASATANQPSLSQIADGVAKGEITLVDVLLPGLGIADLAHHGLHHLAGEDLIGDGLDAAVDADLGRLPLAEVEVRSAEFDERTEVVVDDGHGTCEKGRKVLAGVGNDEFRVPNDE